MCHKQLLYLKIFSYAKIYKAWFFFKLLRCWSLLGFFVCLFVILTWDIQFMCDKVSMCMSPFMLISYFQNYRTIKIPEAFSMEFYLKFVWSVFIQRKRGGWAGSSFFHWHIELSAANWKALVFWFMTERNLYSPCNIFSSAFWAILFLTKFFETVCWYI